MNTPELKRIAYIISKADENILELHAEKRALLQENDELKRNFVELCKNGRKWSEDGFLWALGEISNYYILNDTESLLENQY